MLQQETVAHLEWREDLEAWHSRATVTPYLNLICARTRPSTRPHTPTEALTYAAGAYQLDSRLVHHAGPLDFRQLLEGRFQPTNLCWPILSKRSLMNSGGGAPLGRGTLESGIGCGDGRLAVAQQLEL